MAGQAAGNFAGYADRDIEARTAYMEQQELLRAVAKTVFYADYQSQAAAIFNRIDAKYKQLNHDYDEDTQHMINRPQQQSWDAYFKKRLENAPTADEGR